MNIVYNVPQNHVVIIERFGKYARTQRAGLNFRIPFLETPRTVDTAGSNWSDFANKEGVFIELAEQTLETPARECLTKDNTNVLVDAVLSFRIIDPVKAVYEVDQLELAITNASLNALRGIIGSMELDAAVSRRQEINDAVAAQLAEVGRKWGIQFIRAEVQQFRADEKTLDIMRQQLDADRRKRAAIAEAEGKAQAAVTIATAEAEAAKISAQGQAAAIEIIAAADAVYARSLTDALGDRGIDVMIAQKYLAGFEVISKNPAEKIYLPSNFNGILSVGSDS
jgi:regulator of protease activity HflC (stomatin/prohibitin superfamily)